jgi:hypothetical protein
MELLKAITTKIGGNLKFFLKFEKNTDNKNIGTCVG